MRIALLALLLTLPSGVAVGGEIRPRDAAELTRIHVEFQWDPVCLAGSYELEVVPDNGRSDPFDRVEPVVRRLVRGVEPRVVVRSGLRFGEAYAWRVRPARGQTPPWSHRHRERGRGHGWDAGPWGATHRFQIKPLPELPLWTVSQPERGPLQPGLTIMDVALFRQVDEPNANRGVAVDRNGAPVWFNEPVRSSFDTRLLPSGRVSYIDLGRAFEATLDGEITWASPDDPALEVHHEVFPMPNGNFLAIIFDSRGFEFEDGEVRTLRGDRIVEFDRETNEIVWDWATLDHWSIEDMPPDDAGRARNWSHTNAAVYNEADNSVYISSRNLSRITRIDYDTGEIIYNMGQEMPSGDVHFGDGLFRVQHAPELLPNGNMLLHDNGVLAEGTTRVIELEFDDPDFPSSASVVWEYLVPAFSSIIGDADRLSNGNTLVASGVRPGVVYEVSDAGALVWKIAVEDALIYRAERVRALVVRSPAQRNASIFAAALFQAECRERGQRPTRRDGRGRGDRP